MCVRAAGEKHMWLGIAVGRHCVCETGVGAGERYMLLGVAVGR